MARCTHFSFEPLAPAPPTRYIGTYYTFLASLTFTLVTGIPIVNLTTVVLDYNTSCSAYIHNYTMINLQKKKKNQQHIFWPPRRLSTYRNGQTRLIGSIII